MKAREYLELVRISGKRNGHNEIDMSEGDWDFYTNLINEFWKKTPEFEMGDFVWSEDKTYFGIVTYIHIDNHRQTRWSVEWHKWQEDLEPPFVSPEYVSRPPAPAAREDVKRKFPTSLVWKAE